MKVMQKKVYDVLLYDGENVCQVLDAIHSAAGEDFTAIEISRKGGESPFIVVDCGPYYLGGSVSIRKDSVIITAPGFFGCGGPRRVLPKICANIGAG